MSKVEIRKPFDEVPHVLATIVDDGMTQQSFKEQCDVNNILKKFERTGMLDHASRFQGSYGDFVGAQEYHEYMNNVVSAQQMFDQMPAAWRKRFGNDPAQFLEFMDDPENVDEMRSLGMLPKEPDDGKSGETDGQSARGKAAIDRSGVSDSRAEAPQDGSGDKPEGGKASKAGE